MNPAHRRILELALEKTAYQVILLHVFGKGLRIGVPLRRPFRGNAKANTDWMYFLSHSRYSAATSMVMWLLSLRIWLPRPLARAL